MMIKNWWNKTPDVSKVEDMLPLLNFVDDATIQTKDGYFVQTIELLGKDYTGLEAGVVDSLYKSRKRFIDTLPSHFMPTIISTRHKLGKDFEQVNFPNRLSSRINDVWTRNFMNSYRTRHYLVLRTAKPSLLDQLALKSENDEGGSSEQSYRDLQEAVTNTLLILDEYNPHVLKKDEHSSFWASIINGRHVTQKTGAGDELSRIISGVGISWPEGKRYQVYEDYNGDRYSGWLAFKVIAADGSSSRLMNDLFRVQADFTVYQNFQVIDKSKTLEYIQDKEKNILSFSKGGEIQLEELREARNRVDAKELSFGSYSLAIQVFGETVEELEDAIFKLKNIPESYGYRIAREKLNQEPLYWSIFPGLEKLNVRKHPLSSENIADYISFSSVGEGIEQNSWGDKPITRFKTLTESEYSFTFHKSSAEQELGHTLIIGGSNSGKTTLYSFLLSQCLKYENFKALNFDRLHGMEVFTRLIDGEYIDFRGNIDLNPLQLPESNENKTFLTSFIESLTNKSDDKSREDIKRLLDMTYSLPQNERYLENVILTLGLKETGSIREAIEKWMPDGTFGHFFTSKHDALNFKKQVVTFDMTTLLDIPEVLGPITHYLFHRLLNIVTSSRVPHAIFVDEVPKYLESDVFGPMILKAAREIRKAEGVLILAAQEASAILDNKHGKNIVESVANYILFSNPTADPHYYGKDGLGLTDEEILWLKQPNKRQVMLKRRGGESTILNVDLSPLGNLLHTFDSGATGINALRNCIKEGGDWKTTYYQSRKAK